MTVIDDGNFLLQNILVWIAPFAAYYFGILIRKYGFQNPESPPLTQQCLVAIPICIIVVMPFIGFLNSAISSDIPAYLTTMAVIMEHGMIMNEKAATLAANKMNKQ